MKYSNIFLFSMAVVLASQTAQAADLDHPTIPASVQAAYDFHQAEAAKVFNQMDSIEDELRDPGLTAERRQTLSVVLAGLRVKEATALDQLHAKIALEQLKIAALNANK